MRCARGCCYRTPLEQDLVHDLAVTIAKTGRVGEIGQRPTADELLECDVVRVEDPQQVRERLGEALVGKRLSAACQRDQREKRVRPERQERRLGRVDELLGGLVRATPRSAREVGGRRCATATGNIRNRAGSGVAQLLGRDNELAQLYDLIDAIGRRGGALVVRGEAGIGKSALLEAAALRAGERNVTVASTTGMPSEARFAFAGLRDLLLPLLEARDRLPQPQHRALEAAMGLADGIVPDPFLVGLAALGLLTDGRAKRPLLLLVDDAQWLDGPSAEALGFVARRLELEPVIVLFAVREGISSAVDESGLPELHLDCLDDASSRALLELASPDLPAELKARVLDEAAGNPLAVIELPATAASVSAAAPGTDTLPLSTRLEQAFTARLVGLDSETPPPPARGARGWRTSGTCAPPRLGSRGGRWGRDPRPGRVPVPASSDPVVGDAGGDSGGATASARCTCAVLTQ
jgi:hypothetical protein